MTFKDVSVLADLSIKTSPKDEWITVSPKALLLVYGSPFKISSCGSNAFFLLELVAFFDIKSQVCDFREDKYLVVSILWQKRMKTNIALIVEGCRF